MSEFAVEIRRISEIKTHNNADSLELAKVNGLENQFVVGKGDMKPGDIVVYFPIDSLIPDKVLEFLPTPIKVKLTGKVPRIKTVKLRGEISQGLAIKANTVPWDALCKGGMKFENLILILSEHGFVDVTEIFEVRKYEPPVVHDATVDGLVLPEHSPYYDIESCDRNPVVVSRYLDKNDTVDVVVQEKLEGTNLAVLLHPDGRVEVMQRSMSIFPRNPETNIRCESPKFDAIPGYFFGNKYWDGAIRGNLFALAKEVQDIYLRDTTKCPSVTIRAELVGPSIQGNWYKLPKQEAYIFEIMVDGRAISAGAYVILMEKYKHLECKFVPLLFVGKLETFLAGKSVAEASNGKSVLNPDKLREGIVIRGVLPVMVDSVIWYVIKQRSPEYLAKSEN